MPTNEALHESPSFPSPFLFYPREPITLVELRMRRFSGLIRAKPDWWRKVHESNIVAKWRAEFVEQDREAVEQFWSGEDRFEYGSGEKKCPRDPITDAQLDYVFDQLRYEAGRVDSATGIFATSIPNVYESRSLIPADARSALLSLVSALKSVPDDEKDWHPGSNNQVLDLVHPSLYCLRIGHSYVREKSADGAVLGVHVLSEDEYRSQRDDLAIYEYGPCDAVSREYQWLPTDFKVSETGDVRALDYINNLHPDKHRAGYVAICSILSRFIPLFEAVLSDTLSPPMPLAVCVHPQTWYSMEIPKFGYRDDGAEDDRAEDESEDNDSEREHDTGEEDDDDGPEKEDDPEEKWWREEHWPVVPDPESFTPPSDEGRVQLTLRGRTVQVIVKLANIVLTPESPRYPGGSWHVEGMANEKIVATGLYYYACENITQSRLCFRTLVGQSDKPEDRDQLPYEQDDNKGYYTVYGFGGGDPLNQELGHVVAEEDKCIAFPNIHQHRVDAFELADVTKPGYRKILCFFLVDPFKRIHSTSDIPPQQEEWLTDEMLRGKAMQNMPPELFQMIADYATGGTMSRGEAKEHREKLMNERKWFVLEHNEEVYELEFNMCEH